MPKPHPKAELDGISQVRKGMNSGVAPRILPPDQLAFAINVTNRGGLPKTRPVWRKVALVYRDGVGEPTGSTRARATQALFQGAAAYVA